VKTLLYLHGFLSSPASVKVNALRAGCGDRAEVIAPDLNQEPAAADQTIRRTLRKLLANGESVTVIGSSLGGFFAARAAAEFGLRAVLFNPCLNPWERYRNGSDIVKFSALNAISTFVPLLQRILRRLIGRSVRFRPTAEGRWLFCRRPMRYCPGNRRPQLSGRPDS